MLGGATGSHTIHTYIYINIYMHNTHTYIYICIEYDVARHM